jgi:hypothetical protein
MSEPPASSGYQGYAGPLNLLTSGEGRNLRGGKVTTQVPEGLPLATHVSVALEPGSHQNIEGAKVEHHFDHLKKG